MFKLESYITPILLSYVDRYIKNFKLEDSQVSLWGGDASFHNLDLRLEVLEEELQLPFSFVSGHIRELLIHVPWTKLASEPIVITINTIACTLKLKGRDSPEGSESPGIQNRERPRKMTRPDIEAPPGYVQLLINKIVSNIRIYCNNLILKYVEDDIVLSMNVKHLKFESANEKWDPSYIEVSTAQVWLRKIIAINDLTLCLDKRNAAGKIEIYQEPILYRCSMTMHLLKQYHSATASKASTTRIDVYCNKMEFGMTEQQVPMLRRLLTLVYMLQQKQLKPESESQTDLSRESLEGRRDSYDKSKESWTGWAWSYVSSVLPAPLGEEWDSDEVLDAPGHILNFGFYVDHASITFKISESTNDRYGAHKKVKHFPLLTLQLQGIYSESVINGISWFNTSFGISEISLNPVGFCSCSHPEMYDTSMQYLKIGSETENHKSESLFDVEAVENKGQKKLYNTSWDHHMLTVTESVLLERTPALALDYVYNLEIPSDITSEDLSQIGGDYEYSNLSEKASLRFCLGPLKLTICSGFFHRLATLSVAASCYEYPDYIKPKSEASLKELLPPSEEDFDALNESISKKTFRITIISPTIEIQLMEHPCFEPMKGNLFRRQKKLSNANLNQLHTRESDLPNISLECQYIDISIEGPMYQNRLVHTTCQLPDPPIKLFDSCYQKVNVRVMGLLCKLSATTNHQTTILSPCCISFTQKSILKPQYWVNSDIPHEDITFESECITINGTKAKILLLGLIIEKFLNRDTESSSEMHNSSLVEDSMKDLVLPTMELCIEGIRFKKVTTNSTVSVDISLGSTKAFIFEPPNGGDLSDMQQILFISGPEPKKTQDDKALVEELPLFTATGQFPLSPDNQSHAPILMFNLQEIRVCMDPLLYQWLRYNPSFTSSRSEPFDSSIHKNKTLSEASGSALETPRKLSSQIESVHSSSDREHLCIPRSIPKSIKEDNLDMQERIYNFLKNWFDVWKGMFLSGDISQCTIYFPLVSLSAVGSQGIQEAVETASKKNPPPDIMVITLPFANIRSAQKQNISKYMKTLPVTLPQSIWTPDTLSFPWTMSISDLSCFSIQYGHKLTFLKPVSLSATVGLSTRPAKKDGHLQADTETSLKSDLSYLGVCVHIDMTPVLISTSEIQVYLFASILCGLMDVASNLIPETPKQPLKSPEVLPPITGKGSSNFSPTILHEDSTSECTPSIAGAGSYESLEGDNVKLTAWIQWTITRFTVELFSSESKSKESMDLFDPKLKLVLDAEDIVSSLDFQSVYLKIKSKIGSFSVQHFKRSSRKSKWKAGPFSGVVARLQDESSGEQRHEDNGFFNLTITRANCKHTHTLWGTVQKSKNKEGKGSGSESESSRFITEVVVNIQPIDFIISPKTLRSFYLVMAPLLQLPLSESKPKSDNNSISLNNQVLPLAYLDCQDIRVIIPSTDLLGSEFCHDSYVVHINKIRLAPNAENPICRTPVRPDLYEQAAHARILNIPGSDVEDRQYQLDIKGVSFCTGNWKDLESIVSSSDSGNYNLSSLGLSENPAVKWNNLDQGQPNSSPVYNLWQIAEKFDISIVYAPVMLFRDTTVICGNSVEINFVSDIQVNVSLHQIKLASYLSEEFVVLFEPCNFEMADRKLRRSSYFRCKYAGEEGGSADIVRDSGIDTSDYTNRGIEANLKQDSEKMVFPRPPNPLIYQNSVIPFEVFVTAGKLSFSLYDVDSLKNSQIRQKGKRRASTKLSVDDPGYEGSEESLEDKSENPIKYHPLFFTQVKQPNAFYSNYQLGQKMQISCFDVNIKLFGPERLSVNHIPVEQDFIINLLETRSGIPDPSTGIPPAFLTIKLVKRIGKSASFSVEISKPTKIMFSSTQWASLLKVHEKIMEAKRVPNQEQKLKPKITNQAVFTKPKQENYSKFNDIKEKLFGINSINISFDQIIFAMISESGHEFNLGFGGLRYQLSLTYRPEKILNICNFSSITISIFYEEKRKLLLNPWSISVNVNLFWEPWQAFDSDPQVQVTAESDCILVDISPEQIQILEVVLKDIQEFIASFPSGDSSEEKEFEALNELKIVEKDQHYKDDLRAGAFQFVDVSSSSLDEQPLPYQVMFWTGDSSVMAWKYPQPRALTKVRVFPVPYKISANDSEEQVMCNLEYWSDCRNCYMPYTKFYLSESEVCHLSLPEGNPQRIVATTWRVVISTVRKEDIVQKQMISPRALAACMRIDSYFNKSLVPNLTAAFYVTKMEVSLHSYCSKQIKLPDCLKGYTPDFLYPENQKFLTLSLDNCTTYFTSWNMDAMSFEFSCAMKCVILDYAFLTEHSLIEPFTSKLEISLADSVKCKYISKPIQIYFGPSAAHTLAVSAQLWSESINNCASNEMELVIMTRYVICNDTNVSIRFGQNLTDEDILLHSRHFHLYSWRSNKKKDEIKIAIEENGWQWSKGISICAEGTESVYLGGEKNITVLITVKALSSSQKQVIISGQLVISNMLLEHFEVKVMQETSPESKDAAFRNAAIYVLNGRSCSSTFFVDSHVKNFLRLRFHGLDSAWTGDIPLREHSTSSQPWLVKVPLQERGQFLSIWCRIVIQDVSKSKKILAMLWPLFTVKSNLPINTKVHIETPSLNVQLDAMVSGKGEIQQLYCPGTIDHSHQLSFQLDNGVSASNRYVPLNYSLVDQDEFFKKMDKEDISKILSVLNNFGETKWPYFEDELDNIEWIVDDQPLTHVQVQYQNAFDYSCSLLVELIPWCLIVNTLGTNVSLVVNGMELLQLQHHGIVTPPKIEENFNLGVKIRNSWFYSEPLQLAKSDWSQSYYMPKITGTIPIDGSIITSIKCDSQICMMSVSSTMSKEMRLVKISTTHIICSYLSTHLQVACFAVPNIEEKFPIPSNMELYSFTLQPDLHKNNSGVPIVQWYNVKSSMETSDYILYVAFCIKPELGWSCPIRIDKVTYRKCFSVLSNDESIPICLTSHEHKGQTYICIYNDKRPQIFIENRSDISLLCGQANNEDEPIEESHHFYWQCEIKPGSKIYYTMPALCEKYPELNPQNLPENIVFSCDNYTNDNIKWSSSINIVNDDEQFLRIPYYGDVKVLVKNAACTTHVIVESVSQVEINAKDIRVRLSLHEALINKSSLKDVGVNSSVQEIQSFTTIKRPDDESSSSDKEKHSDMTISSSSSTRSIMVRTLPMKDKWSSTKIDVFINRISIMLITDLEIVSHEICELANLTCDNIYLSVLQSESLKIQLSIADIQFDNQLYTRESYDFPVTFIAQKPNPPTNIKTLNVPIESLLDLENGPLFLLEIIFDTCKDQFRSNYITGAQLVKVTLNPVSCYVEDVYFNKLAEYVNYFSPTKLVLLRKRQLKQKASLNSGLVLLPEIVLFECSLLANPLTIRRLVISPVSLMLSVHSSIKVYIALDQSPLQFGMFERRRLLTTPFRLGLALTMHYLSGAIFGVGWVVSSLELLGSPGGLARAMGTGLRDFISMPYQGLVQGPVAFLKGITQGSASLMKHVTAGTLQSVTKLASSVARNLDRLTLDQEHLRRTEEQRRQKPQGVAEGFMQGLTGLGISILGAVGGIAHHPIQSVMAEGASPRSLAAGVGLGLVGVITKPLSGAAELVALTGQGLLQGVGWNSLPTAKTAPTPCETTAFPNSILKFTWKLMTLLSKSSVLFMTEATSIGPGSNYEAMALVLTSDSLIIINIEDDRPSRVISLSEIRAQDTGDPTLLSFKIQQPVMQPEKNEEELALEMDPVSRARVADYVRNTVGLMNLQDLSPEHSDISISPLSSPSMSITNMQEDDINFYVNPQNRNYFLCLMRLAKQQNHQNYNFPVL